MKKLIAVFLVATLLNPYFPSSNANNDEKINEYMLAMNTTLSSSTSVSGDTPVTFENINTTNNKDQSLNINNSDPTLTSEVSDVIIDKKTKEKSYIVSESTSEETIKYFENLNSEYDNIENNQNTSINILDNTSYSVGDTRDFYQAWSDSACKNVSKQTVIECMYVGEHCTVWADSNSTTNYDGVLKISLSQAKEIADSFDSKWNNMCSWFGDYFSIATPNSNGAINKGDADLDGKLAIVCYDINDDYKNASETAPFQGTYSMGHYQSVDNERSIKNKYGSEYYINYMDCIHIDTFPSMGKYKSSPLDNVSNVFSTLMHETQHLIQNSYGKSLPTYLNEGFSMAAEHLIFGSAELNNRVTHFNENYIIGRSLTSWYGTSTQKLSSYSSSYLLCQYLRTQYIGQDTVNSDGSSIYKIFLEKYKEIYDKTADVTTQLNDCFYEIYEKDMLELYSNYYRALIMKKASGPYGFAGEAWADNINPRMSNVDSMPSIYNGGCIFLYQVKDFDTSTDIKNLQYMPINKVSYHDINSEVFDSELLVSIDDATYKQESDFPCPEGKRCVSVSFPEELLYNTDIYPVYEDDTPAVPISEPISIYRLYNPHTGEHLFTSKENEYNKLAKIGWTQEGESFDGYENESPPDDAVAVYRMFNPNGFKGLGDHHYTKSTGEISKLVAVGWKIDFSGEPAFYTVGDYDVYKLYNKKTGAHHYTPKVKEKDKLSNLGWVYEGIAWTTARYYTSSTSN